MSFAPEHFVVWTEIPVTDLEASAKFYEAITGGELTRMEMGGGPAVVFKTTDYAKGIAGHLYVGKPAPAGQGPTTHLMIEGTLEDAMERVTKAGGTVLSEPIAIPPGRFAYIHDLDKNSIGIFQPNGEDWVPEAS